MPWSWPHQPDMPSILAKFGSNLWSRNKGSTFTEKIIRSNIITGWDTDTDHTDHCLTVSLQTPLSFFSDLYKQTVKCSHYPSLTFLEGLSNAMCQSCQYKHWPPCHQYHISHQFSCKNYSYEMRLSLAKYKSGRRGLGTVNPSYKLFLFLCKWSRYLPTFQLFWEKSDTAVHREKLENKDFHQAQIYSTKKRELNTFPQSLDSSFYFQKENWDEFCMCIFSVGVWDV